MIDHNYKIIIREVPSASCMNRFIAELSEISIVVGGKRLEAQCPQQAFSGNSQTAAMINANDALRNWLKTQTISIEKGMVVS